MQRVGFRPRIAQCRPGGEDRVDHPACRAVADREPAVVRRDRDPVREVQVVDDLPQDAVLRILVHRAGAVGQVRPDPGGPRVGEEQIALGVEIEVVGAFEQLVAVGVDQRLQLLGLRVVDQDAAVPGRQVELAVVPAGALRLAGLADLRRRVAVDHRDELAVRRQIGNPAAADRDEPEIALGVERAAFEKLGRAACRRDRRISRPGRLPAAAAADPRAAPARHWGREPERRAVPAPGRLAVPEAVAPAAPVPWPARPRARSRTAPRRADLPKHRAQCPHQAPADPHRISPPLSRAPRVCARLNCSQPGRL